MSAKKIVEKAESFYSDVSDACNLVKVKNESTILNILPSNDKESSDQQELQDESLDQSDFVGSPEERRLTCLLEHRNRNALDKGDANSSNHSSSPSVGLQKEIEEEILGIRQTADKFKASIELRSDPEEEKLN